MEQKAVFSIIFVTTLISQYLRLQVLTQKADDASAYNQGDLVEIPLAKVDAVIPSGEAVPFTLTIEYQGVSQ